MDMEMMCKHYQAIFKDPKDVLDWVMHDLKHMGLPEAQITEYETKCKEYLNLK